MTKVFLNPNLAIYFEGESIRLIDFGARDAYELERDDAIRLVDIGFGSEFDAQRDRDFEEAGIIQREQPEPPLWEWGIASRMFHLATRRYGRAAEPVEGYDDPLSALDIRLSQRLCNTTAAPPTSLSGVEQIQLPEVQPEQLNRMPVSEVLDARRTARGFPVGALPLQSLAALLAATFGLRRQERPNEPNEPGTAPAKRTSSPSLGGIGASESVVLCLNVSGVKPAAYRYCPATHSLELAGELLGEELSAALRDQQFALDACVIIALFTRFDELW